MIRILTCRKFAISTNFSFIAIFTSAAPISGKDLTAMSILHRSCSRFSWQCDQPLKTCSNLQVLPTFIGQSVKLLEFRLPIGGSTARKFLVGCWDGNLNTPHPSKRFRNSLPSWLKTPHNLWLSCSTYLHSCAIVRRDAGSTR